MNKDNMKIGDKVIVIDNSCHQYQAKVGSIEIVENINWDIVKLKGYPYLWKEKQLTNKGFKYHVALIRSQQNETIGKS